MFLIILMFLPILVEGKIMVNITVNSNETDISVNISHAGNDYKIVTDEELRLFNVTKEKINGGFKVELGKIPDDLFLKDPTPYGDLFNKYKWEQMKRRIRIKRTSVVDIITKDTLLDSHEHINGTPDNIKSTRKMFTIVDNSVASMWSKYGLPKDRIVTNFTIDFGYGKIKYENNWRNDTTRIGKAPIGLAKPGKIDIHPGQNVVTELTASKTILLIELTYEAQLIGSIIGDYADLYGKYHFWAPTVKSIMKAGNMTNEIITREILEIRCFTNPRLKVFDKETGNVVEPPKKKRPRMKIIRNKNTTKIIYIKTKKPKLKINNSVEVNAL